MSSGLGETIRVKVVDYDRFRHYVRKDKVLQAMIDGIPCTAVCPDCKALHE